MGQVAGYSLSAQCTPAESVRSLTQNSTHTHTKLKAEREAYTRLQVTLKGFVFIVNLTESGRLEEEVTSTEELPWPDWPHVHVREELS